MRIWSKILTAGAAAGAAFFSAPAPAAADDAPAAQVTFTKDVLPILQANCQVCHRPGGTDLGGMVAPMAFTSYDETRPWAKSIAKEVESKRMPPWHATEEFHGVFANERAMSEKDIATIVKWAATGASKGDDKDAPAPLQFPTAEWTIGEPDLVLELPEEYLVGDDVEDQYVNLSVDFPEPYASEEHFVQGMQFKAGGPVVHHIIGYVVPKPSKEAKTDESDGRGMIGGIAPGNEPDWYPEGYGFRIPPNSKFVFQMHYHKEKGAGTAVKDRSKVGFKFHPKGAKVKTLHVDPVGNHDFTIPPNNPNWEVGMARILEKPIKVLDLMPHMHLRGKAARYVAFYPDGKVEKLLEVPRYDFNWQTSYEFKEPKILPAGTRLEVSMWFDNSANNPANPDPNKAVRFGGPTTDEMALGWLTYTEVLDPAEVPAGPEKIASAGQ